MSTGALSRPGRHIGGFSLVELMIAMTLGLVTIGAVGWVYLGTTQTYRSQDALARLQEGARYAFELISSDLRMAGAAGCGNSARVNVVNNPATNWYANLFDQPLVSLERNNLVGIRQYSDALRVVRADVSREYIVQSHDAGTFVFNVGTHDIAAGDLLLATDCTQAAVFQASAAGSPQVAHAAGGTPGNGFANLGSGGAAYTFVPGSRLYKLSGVTYYVAQNPAGELALFRQRPVGASAAVTAEELVEGVEDIQVSFGVDTDATPDGAPNFIDPDGDGNPYLRGDQVNSGSVPGATPQDKWNRVVSVRVSLLMRTVENNVIAGPSQRYTYNGATVDAPDRRIRRVFTHVVNLRNR